MTAGAVNYLIENHDLISEIEPLPYIPGREKAIINDSPTSPHDAEAMRAHRELVNGYYLDTRQQERENVGIGRGNRRVRPRREFREGDKSEMSQELPVTGYRAYASYCKQNYYIEFRVYN